MGGGVDTEVARRRKETKTASIKKFNNTCSQACSCLDPLCVTYHVQTMHTSCTLDYGSQYRYYSCGNGSVLVVFTVWCDMDHWTPQVIALMRHQWIILDRSPFPNTEFKLVHKVRCEELIEIDTKACKTLRECALIDK